MSVVFAPARLLRDRNDNPLALEERIAMFDTSSRQSAMSIERRLVLAVGSAGLLAASSPSRLLTQAAQKTPENLPHSSGEGFQAPP
jgi:hypothetical protein